MRVLFIALLFATACAGVLLAANALAHHIHSHLLVEPGKQFVLGGGQPGAFRVSARNVGLVPVQLLERSSQGRISEHGRLEPGQSARVEFAAGAAVLVRNLGNRRAELDLGTKGPTNSQMVYEAVPVTQ